MAKHVVFVLDVSGSMEGKKLLQLKNAMSTILGELRPIDFISILVFSNNVTEWRPGEGAKEASVANIDEAKRYVSSLEAEGGTNIYDALLRGIRQTEAVMKAKHNLNVQPMVYSSAQYQ